MDHSFTMDKESGVCVIRATGTIRRPLDSLTLVRTAGDVARNTGCSCFLFDLRDASIIRNTMGAYETVVAPEKHGLSRTSRVAVVYDALTREEKFMENVGVNRGAYYYRVFDDINSAWEWLGKPKNAAEKSDEDE